VFVRTDILGLGESLSERRASDDACDSTSQLSKHANLRPGGRRSTPGLSRRWWRWPLRSSLESRL